jgi:hypothetical protein
VLAFKDPDALPLLRVVRGLACETWIRGCHTKRS